MRADRWPDGRTPVLLTAHAGELLSTDATAIERYLDAAQGLGVDDVAAHLLRTRRIRRHRAVIRAADRDELAAGLRAVAAGEDHPLVARAAEIPDARVAFVFPGQGNQWPGMGAEAYGQLPDYHGAADECAAAFTEAGLMSPLRYLTGAQNTEYAEIEIEGAQFVHHVALAAAWRSCGVLPDITIGHSLGEIAAAYDAGAMSLADAVAVVAARAGVVERLSGRYAVAALGIGARDALTLIAETPGWLELSVVNAETAVAVSGDRDAVQAAVATARARGQFGREITVNFPVHTSVLETLREDLHSQWPGGEFAHTPVQFIGGATGDVVPAGTPSADYWYRNLRDMVRFDRAVGSATRCGAKIFVEMSAHPALLFAMAQVLGDRPAVLVGSGRRDGPLVGQLSANIAAVAVAGPDHDWRYRGPAAGNPLRDFPNAPMRAVHMWATAEPPPEADLTVAAEDWREQPPMAAPRGQRSVGVLDLGAGPLAESVRGAFERSPAATATDPADADVLVVLAPEAADGARAVAEIAERAGAGLFDYVDAIGPRCRDVWLVTVGGEQAGPDDPVPSSTSAALAAMHRSIGFEHPDQAFGHLDLPGDPLTDSTADTVVDILLGGSGETALRRGVALRRSLTDAPLATAWALDSGVLDNVVITGGAGSIGMHYARYLAEHGAKRITLLSRRGAGPTELAALTNGHVTEIVSVRCDITDAAGVAAAAAGHGGDGASLLIHAAGTADFATRDGLRTESVADTLRAKVDGAAVVTDRWPLRPDARILLCSSVIGVWGGKGTAAYAAGNRMLDVLAAQLRGQGRRCTSMRWGLWQGHADSRTGMVDAAETARVQRSGLRPMSPESAIEASLCDYPVDPLVLAADADRLQMFLGSQHDGTAGAATDADAAQAVRTHLAAVLNVADAAGLEIDASLFDLGIDSLLALDLRKRLKRTLGRTVALATLLGGITGTDLIAELNIEERLELPRD